MWNDVGKMGLTKFIYLLRNIFHKKRVNLHWLENLENKEMCKINCGAYLYFLKVPPQEVYYRAKGLRNTYSALTTTLYFPDSKILETSIFFNMLDLKGVQEELLPKCIIELLAHEVLHAIITPLCIIDLDFRYDQIQKLDAEWPVEKLGYPTQISLQHIQKRY